MIARRAKARRSTRYRDDRYGNLFLRITQAISRAQELAADRLSAEVAGAKNAIDALVRIEGAALAYEP